MDIDEITQLGLDQVIQLAEQMQQAGRIADAVSLYSLWATHVTSNDRHIALFNQGVMQLNHGDVDGAEHAYRQSLVHYPGFAQARINLGLLLERKGLYEEAMLEWSQVAAAGYLQGAAHVDMQTLALNHIGRLQEQLKRYDLAEHALTQSLQIKLIRRMPFSTGFTCVANNASGLLCKRFQVCRSTPCCEVLRRWRCWLYTMIPLCN